jgi:hypothetical protein
MYSVTIAAVDVVLIVDVAENEKKDKKLIIYRFDNGILMEDGICGGRKSVSTCRTVHSTEQGKIQ